MAKVITPITKDKYYSPVTYSQFCIDSNHDSLDDFIQSQIHDIIDRVYPIGAYYISADAISPAVLFNYGNWELLEEGRTILGSGEYNSLSSWETKTLADGSKWVKIYYQEANTAWTKVEETTTIYDRLSHLSKFYNHLEGDSGHLELLMEYESLNLSARWKQRAYPFSWSASANDYQDAVISRSSYTATSVEEGCFLPEVMTTSGGFYGLGKDTSGTAEISGYPGSASRRFGLRNKSKDSSSHTYVYAGNAGFEQTCVTLWVRYDNVIRFGVEAGTTGGNAAITLLSTQIPSHRHGIGFVGYRYPGGVDDHASGTEIGDQVTTNTGGSAAHNNLQPYTNVFVWRRIEEKTEEQEV